MPPEEYLLPWKGREIWLEAGLEGELLILTEQGCKVISLPYSNTETDSFFDQALYCHYTIDTNEKAARFTLWRTMEDCYELFEKAVSLGVVQIVGLFQELSQRFDRA